MYFIKNNRVLKIFVRVCLVIPISTSLLLACSDGSTSRDGSFVNTSSETGGSIAFKILWSNRMIEKLFQRAQSPGNDVCQDYHIDTVSCNVYDATNSVIASQSWPCLDHSGTISGIPAGSGRWLILEGIVSGTVQWRGQSGTFSVFPDEITQVGSVSIGYIGEDVQRPAVETTNPVHGSNHISLNTVITAKFSEDVVLASVIPAFTVRTDSAAVIGSVEYDAATWTATFIPERDLSQSTKYTAIITSAVEDMAGNHLAADYSWEFTSTSMDAPEITTQQATAVTENSARLNALINPKGFGTTYYFEYGTDINYNLKTVTQDAGSGMDPVPVFADITGLDQNQAYHFRVVAENSGGTSLGLDSSFSTDAIWAKTYGEIGSGSTVANKIRLTSDNGYILSEDTDLLQTGEFCAWVAKLGAEGGIDWEKTYDDLNFAADLQQIADGGYIIAGNTDKLGAGADDIGIIRLAADRTTTWAKTYGESASDRMISIEQVSDGGFIVLGETRNFGVGIIDIWILKLNPDGTVVWQKSYGGPLTDQASSILPTADGGFIVGGSSESFGAGNVDVWLLKLHGDGTVAWQKTYGGSGTEFCTSVVPTADSGYLVVASTDSFGAGDFDFWILKLDADGNVTWQKTYGGIDHDHPTALQLTRDGGYIVVGDSLSFSGVDYNRDIWVFKLDTQGMIIWQKTYGGTGLDNGPFVQPTPDDGYVLAASTGSFSASSLIWILKLGENGALGCGFGVDSSALSFTSDATGVMTAANVADTSGMILSHFDFTGQYTTAAVGTQCP